MHETEVVSNWVLLIKFEVSVRAFLKRVAQYAGI